MTCHPTSIVGHMYIIVAIEYFMKWVEAMPTFSNDGMMASLFMFNHINAQFKVPKKIMTDHGSHFLEHHDDEIVSHSRVQTRSFIALLSGSIQTSRGSK